MNQSCPDQPMLRSAPAPHSIGAGDLGATFLPDRGMLGASLRFRGVELLRRIDDLEAAAAKGSTAGIPLLHPWANRLAGFTYRCAGRDVALDKASPLVHLDSNGLPMHGVPWSQLHWSVREATHDRIAAELDWNLPELLSVFPFPHRLEMVVSISGSTLTVQTAAVAGPESPVPVSFGFHPFFGIAGVPREHWRLSTPPMRRITLDAGGIPSGPSEPFEAFDEPLANYAFDHGFALLTDRPVFVLSGGGVRVGVEFVRGFQFAQIFAPPGKDYIAIEPMTAPTNALVTGRDLTVIPPRGRFDTVFRIHVEETS